METWTEAMRNPWLSSPSPEGRAGKRLWTEVIYGAETQQPDLLIPPPPDSNDEKYEDEYNDENGETIEGSGKVQPAKSIELQTLRKPNGTDASTPLADVDSEVEAA